MSFDINKCKVEVGQVWIDPMYGYKYRISCVTSTDCYAISSDTGIERRFGDLKDGYPYHWAPGWHIEDEQTNVNQSVSPAKDPPTLLNFFKSVQDGYCPCNVVQSQCDYHKK